MSWVKSYLDDLFKQAQNIEYPEWNAPLTPKEGISEEEKNEKVDYREKKNAI